jgi:hypothetical protein
LVILYALGYCGKFGYALQATAANLVMRYGPLWRIWLYTMGQCLEGSLTVKIVKICNDFRAIGYSAGFGYVLWAITQYLVMYYEPKHIIWL